MSCIFCDIVANKISCHKIWEDKKHIAFLSIYPNTEGFSIVIPKTHYPSYVFNVPNKILNALMRATKQVSRLLDRTFDDVGRCGLIFEGFGVDHIHSKLIPMHGTSSSEAWQPIEAKSGRFFERYEGYLSSHDGVRANDKQLAVLAEKIRHSN